MKLVKLSGRVTPEFYTLLFATLASTLLLVFLSGQTPAIASERGGNLDASQTSELWRGSADSPKTVTVCPGGGSPTMCNYGPKTPGTMTDGLQEALNAVSGGGVVKVIGCGTLYLKASVFATGSNQGRCYHT